MRIADRTSARSFLSNVHKAKSAYAKTQQQISSTYRFERLSDDLSAGTRVLRINMDLHKSEVHLDNVDAINLEMDTAFGVLENMEDIMVKVHELVLKGENGPTGESDVGPEVLANEIKNLKDQILTLANSKYGKKYTFGGSNSSPVAPFTIGDNGNLNYNGIPMESIKKDDVGYYYEGVDEMGDPTRTEIPMDEEVYMDVGLGVRMKGSQVEDGSGFLISFSGLDILGFGTDENGNSNNIFDCIKSVEDAFRDENTDALGPLHTHLVKMTDEFRLHSADIGARANFLDNMSSRLKTTVSDHKIRRDSLMGTDDIEASTTLGMNDYVLKAVLQMGGHILPTSLMDFIR